MMEENYDYGTALRATSRLLNHTKTSTTETYIGRNEADRSVEVALRG
jgi:hypothetical protein